MSRPALTPPQTNIIRRGTWVLWELLLLDQFLSFHARKAKIFTSLVHLLAILSAQHTIESAIHNKETPQKVPTPARHRNPLCLVRAYPIATKSTMLIKITMYIYLHARTHQPVHTQVMFTEVKPITHSENRSTRKHAIGKRRVAPENTGHLSKTFALEPLRTIFQGIL